VQNKFRGFPYTVYEVSGNLTTLRRCEECSRSPVLSSGGAQKLSSLFSPYSVGCFQECEDFKYVGCPYGFRENARTSGVFPYRLRAFGGLVGSPIELQLPLKCSEDLSEDWEDLRPSEQCIHAENGPNNGVLRAKDPPTRPPQLAAAPSTKKDAERPFWLKRC
jgi:hypothetical protein